MCKKLIYLLLFRMNPLKLISFPYVIPLSVEHHFVISVCSGYTIC